MLVLQPGKTLEQRSAADLPAARVAQGTTRELMNAAVGLRESAAVTARHIRWLSEERAWRPLKGEIARLRPGAAFRVADLPEIS